MGAIFCQNRQKFRAILRVFALKCQDNYKMQDVTAGYIVSDVERLRTFMQRITAYLVK